MNAACRQKGVDFHATEQQGKTADPGLMYQATSLMVKG